MKISGIASPDIIQAMRTVSGRPASVPLTHNGRQIGTCYAEMTPQGVRMVAELAQIHTKEANV